MLIFIRHFLLSLSTAINLSKKKNFSFFYNVFIIRFFYAFTFLRNFSFRRNEKYKTFFSNFSNFSVSFSEIISNLNEKGFYDKIKVNNDDLIKIIDDINLETVKISFKKVNQKISFEDHLKANASLDSIFKKSLELNLSHVALNIDLNKTKMLKKFVSDGFFKNIAYNYLESKKVSVAALCYISNPMLMSEQEKKDNAQYYHYDNDFRKFFKVFIYLNDVPNSAGPHSFVCYTHKRRSYKHLISERITDEEIIKTYGKKNIITFNRPRGSMIVEDTFGLHKGTAPTTNSRKVLILVFGKNKDIGIYDNLINL